MTEILTLAVNFSSGVILLVFKIGLFVSILCYVLVTFNCILEIAPGSFGIANGSCKIPVNQAQF